MEPVRTPHHSVAQSPEVNPIVRLKKLPEDSRHGLLGSAKQISPVPPPTSYGRTEGFTTHHRGQPGRLPKAPRLPSALESAAH